MTIVLGVLAAVLILTFLMGIRVVRPTERGLIERFGKYIKFGNPGFHWIIPVVDQLIKVNITEMSVNAKRQEVITKDNLNASVDANIYFKVKDNEEDVKRSQYSVYKFQTQIVALAQTTLRNILGTLSLKEANSGREHINKELTQALAKEVSDWGVAVLRSELQEIDPPNDVQETMNQIVKAANAKLSAVDFAKARETEADGLRMAQVKKAQGEAEANILRAKAEAEAIKLVNESAEKYFVGNAQVLKQLETAEASLEKNTKYIFSKDAVTPIMLFGANGLDTLTDSSSVSSVSRRRTK